MKEKKAVSPAESKRQPTNDPNDQLIIGIITTHQQGIVDDEVAGEELGITVYRSSQHSLAMRTDVQRIVPDHLQKVLIQQDYITAFFACVCFNISVPEGALQIKNL